MKPKPHGSAEVEAVEQAKRSQLVDVHDVVQLDPAYNNWGAALAVVDRVYGFGIRVYILVPPDAFGRAYLRVNHGHYARIGRAEWVLKEAEPTRENEGGGGT